MFHVYETIKWVGARSSARAAATNSQERRRRYSFAKKQKREEKAKSVLEIWSFAKKYTSQRGRSYF